MEKTLKIRVEDDGVVTVEGESISFRAQASEVQLSLQLDSYERVYEWRGAVPKVKAHPGVGVIGAILVLAGSLLSGCAAPPDFDRVPLLLCALPGETAPYATISDAGCPYWLNTFRA